MAKKLIIIDGFSLANRAFFALPPLATSTGQPTNAVYGMATMLLKLLDESNPDYLLVAFDVAVPTFRHQEYAAYKGKRLKMEDALKTQFPIIRELLAVLKVPIIEEPGFEADDVIGTLAKQGARRGLDVEIVTGDRDAFQLVEPRVKVLYTRKGITEVDRVDEEFIQNRYQLTPEQLIDLKGLMGDSSDNIPGIPGFGEKTALKYLHQYQTMDGIYQNVDQIARERDRELLITHREQAYLSRRLAQIVTDLKLAVDPVACCLHQEYSKEELLEFCREYEFHSLFKKLSGEELEVIRKIEEIQYELTIAGSDNLETLVESIRREKFCIIQFLASTVNWTEVEWLGVGVGTSDRNWFYQLSPQTALPGQLVEILEDGEILKYGHDLKKQMIIAHHQAITINGVFEDSLIAGYLLNAGVGGLELEDLTEIYLQKTVPAWKNERGVKFSVFSLPKSLPVEVISKIAGGRLEALRLLRSRFNQLLDETKLTSLYYDTELPLTRELFAMEKLGVKVDPEVLRAFGQVLRKRQKELETEIYSLVNEEFNISSPKQLGVVLFEKLGLKPPKKNKTGYSTDAEVLEYLVDQHQVIVKILEYRQNIKLQTTYIDSLISLINPKTGRVHTSFNQAVTTTGRLSSTEPNLQNIPIRSGEGKMIRRAFLPEDAGYCFLAADYSQIELRVMAHFSQDPAYKEAFLKGEDIHKFTAAAVYGVPVEMVTREMRDKAKAVNFGIIYGISGFGLAKNIGVSRKEADYFIEAYFKQYPGVKEYVEKLIVTAREAGETQTLLGRLRKLPDLQSRNFTVRSFAERMARNTPIQGTAADIIKLAMVKIGTELRRNPELGMLILQVHDELVFEVKMERWRELAKIVKVEMEQAVSLTVPLVVDFKLGSNWGDMAPIKLED
jgi:DNA polymerase I